ncbi:MAG TPA: histidine kinase [Candidatus Limnocylindrales bacterium]|nr:histidine kinase [Candidatus Limnocylindrales bacterium]
MIAERRTAAPRREHEQAAVAPWASRLDRAIGAELLLLVGLTVVVLWPGQRIATNNGTLDVALNTLAAIAAAGAAALAWIRYRIDREVAALYETSAFLVLCMSRAMVVGIAALGTSDELGMTLDRAQQWPLYAWSLARFVTGVLLVLAAEASLRGWRQRGRSVAVIAFAPAAALVAVFVALRAVEPSLPLLFGPSGVAALGGDTAATPGMDLLGLGMQAIIGLVYVRGAQLYRRVYLRRGQAYAAWVTIALVLAAVSQIHWAMFPGIYRPVVVVDDALRAIFSLTLLLGIEAQFRGDLGDLRTANARLRALRTADAERAALAAQARVARDVHDGLSQELWLAKLKQGRLAKLDDMPAAASQDLADLGDAVDRALGHARTVIETMSPGAPARSLQDSVRDLVEEFERRTGIAVEMSLDDLTDASLTPSRSRAVAAEVLPIVGEALANVRKHADATVVRVSGATSAGNGGIEIRVADNGRGFAASDVGRSAYGIRGMHERAALVGGSVRVQSHHADGTSVLIRVPGLFPDGDEQVS